MKLKSTLRVGDWVEVRSKEEILRTLDKNGRLDELPFMPQMFQYCGKRFRVFKRAHKACDTVNSTGGRKLKNAVHLEALRCDGETYGGCQAGCLIYWKVAWLKPADDRTIRPGDPAGTLQLREDGQGGDNECTEADVRAGTRAERGSDREEPTYICQATQMPYATERLSWWDVRQYFQDCASGNTRLTQMLGPMLFSFYHNLATSGLGFGSALRWAYDAFQRLRGGTPYPWRKAKIPKGGRTPSVKLNLQPGEVVRVKDYKQILETVDEDYRNRGMSFHAELVPYCGGTFRVAKRIDQIIDEKTGRLVKLKNECIVLAGTECVGRYSQPLFCPRGCYSYWREIWLERVSAELQRGRNDQGSDKAKAREGSA